jgi:Plasmid pRiA4b ORF-3-like protein
MPVTIAVVRNEWSVGSDVSPEFSNRFQQLSLLLPILFHAKTSSRESVAPIEGKKSYPVCIAGACASPPEDCGGPEAYMDKVVSLRTCRRRQTGKYAQRSDGRGHGRIAEGHQAQ